MHHKEGMIKSIVKEMKLRQAELPDLPLTSIYLGGGTPNKPSITKLLSATPPICSGELSMTREPPLRQPKPLREMSDKLVITSYSIHYTKLYEFSPLISKWL